MARGGDRPGPRLLGIDQSLAHVQPNGAYHYHGTPVGLVKQLAKGRAAERMTLVGWAADGFPIYADVAHAEAGDPASRVKKMAPSYRLKGGRRPVPPDGPGGRYDGTYTADYEYVRDLGDLDDANGRTGVTPEFPRGTYYYVTTDAFPYVPRHFRGTPDPSFERRGPGGGPGGGRPAGLRRDEWGRPPPPRR